MSETTKKETVESTAKKPRKTATVTKTAASAEPAVEKKPAVKTRTVDDVKPTERVSIDNLCSWDIYFKSEETDKDICVKGGVKGNVKLTASEILAQVQADNIAFVGVDGMGSHASIRITDPVVRAYVFGKDIDPVQLTEEAVRHLLNIEDRKQFRTELEKLVVTNAEKKQIVLTCEHIGIDNVESFKMNLIESISGVRFDY